LKGDRIPARRVEATLAKVFKDMSALKTAEAVVEADVTRSSDEEGIKVFAVHYHP